MSMSHKEKGGHVTGAFLLTSRILTALLFQTRSIMLTLWSHAASIESDCSRELLIYSLSNKDDFWRGRVDSNFFALKKNIFCQTNEWIYVTGLGITWLNLGLSCHQMVIHLINYTCILFCSLPCFLPLHISSFCSFFVPPSFSPDSISSLSSLRIPSSLPSRFRSRSNSVHLCVHTPGCHGNGRRPHKRVDEQKTRRPSSTEMEREKERRKIKFHIYFF